MVEHVNHPKHYNQHPAGIECIDIIRHYTCDIANAIKYLWRAGLKPEMGKEYAEKEMEDLEKALWYIEDYKKNKPTESGSHVERRRIGEIVHEVTGYDIANIVEGYEENIATAMGCLLRIGIIRNGEVRRWTNWDYAIEKATHAIQSRILDIDAALLNKGLKDLAATLNGQAIDGEDYVSKPGCIRETEPEYYDPLNIIIRYGTAYCLSDEIRKKSNGTLYTPCDNCDLRRECQVGAGSEMYLCRLLDAANNEYFREVGTVKYAPSFGTIEVIDEKKEFELDQKRWEEENKRFEEELGIKK